MICLECGNMLTIVIDKPDHDDIYWYGTYECKSCQKFVEGNGRSVEELLTRLESDIDAGKWKKIIMKYTIDK